MHLRSAVLLRLSVPLLIGVAVFVGLGVPGPAAFFEARANGITVDSLPSLEPLFPARIPVDPFTGNPFTLIVVADRPVISSPRWSQDDFGVGKILDLRARLLISPEYFGVILPTDTLPPTRTEGRNDWQPTREQIAALESVLPLAVIAEALKQSPDQDPEERLRKLYEQHRQYVGLTATDGSKKILCAIRNKNRDYDGTFTTTWTGPTAWAEIVYDVAARRIDSFVVHNP